MKEILRGYQCSCGKVLKAVFADSNSPIVIELENKIKNEGFKHIIINAIDLRKYDIGACSCDIATRISF